MHYESSIRNVPRRAHFIRRPPVVRLLRWWKTLVVQSDRPERSEHTIGLSERSEWRPIVVGRF